MEGYTPKPDELLRERGANHSQTLAAIAERLKEKFDDPKLFSPETDGELNTWVLENTKLIQEILEDTFGELKELKSSESPGHELSHYLNNLNSALRIFEEYGTMTELEKLEVVLACMGHDLGRYSEKNLEETGIDPKTSLFLVPALVGRKQIATLPESLQLRILYDIASGSIPKTEHRTADVVHQADREELNGAATVARDMAFDVTVSGKEIRVRKEGGLEKKMPIPDSPGDTSFLINMEFWMRNVYPPVSPGGQEVSSEHKKEGAVILMLGAEGNEAVLQQIFAPELGLITKEELHWSKKPLAVEVFVSAQEERKVFLASRVLDRYVAGEELAELEKLTATDKISLPANFEVVLSEKLSNCTEGERKNFWLIIQYSIEKQHQRRERDLEKLRGYKADGVTGIVKKWVLEELESREKIYQEKVKVEE